MLRRRNSIHLPAALAALAAVALVACGAPAAPVADAGTPAASATTSAGLPVTVRSAEGREITVTDTTRVVSLWGNITETVIALGLTDRLVGRDLASTLPQVRALPVVTNGHDVSAESVLSLHPTLVLATEDTGPDTAVDQIRSVGVPVIRFANPRNVEEIPDRVRAIARALGAEAAGERVVADIERQLAQLRRPPEGGRPPRVAFLYMRGQAGVYLIAGPKSGADSMIVAAGGVDAGTAMGLDRPFTPITSEALVSAAPEVILMTTTGLESVGGVEGLMQIPGIAETPAGQARRIVAIEDGALFSFGPRTPVALCQLAAGFRGQTNPECAGLAR